MISMLTVNNLTYRDNTYRSAVFPRNMGDLLMQFCMISHILCLTHTHTHTHAHTHTHTQPAGFWLVSAQWSTFYTAVSQKLHLCIIHLHRTNTHAHGQTHTANPPLERPAPYIPTTNHLEAHDAHYTWVFINMGWIEHQWRVCVCVCCVCVCVCVCARACVCGSLMSSSPCPDIIVFRIWHFDEYVTSIYECVCVCVCTPVSFTPGAFLLFCVSLWSGAVYKF